MRKTKKEKIKSDMRRKQMYLKVSTNLSPQYNYNNYNHAEIKPYQSAQTTASKHIDDSETVYILKDLKKLAIIIFLAIIAQFILYLTLN